jgi:hypothetical protein
VAFRRVVEIGEAKSVFRERVNMGRLDFTAVAAKVGIPKIVDHHENDIRSVRGKAGGSKTSRKEQKIAEQRSQFHREQLRWEGPKSINQRDSTGYDGGLYPVESG